MATHYEQRALITRHNAPRPSCGNRTARIDETFIGQNRHLHRRDACCHRLCCDADGKLPRVPRGGADLLARPFGRHAIFIERHNSAIAGAQTVDVAANTGLGKYTVDDHAGHARRTSLRLQRTKVNHAPVMLPCADADMSSAARIRAAACGLWCQDSDKIDTGNRGMNIGLWQPWRAPQYLE